MRTGYAAVTYLDLSDDTQVIHKNVLQSPMNHGMDRSFPDQNSSGNSQEKSRKD
jgi:hypothetical protein